MMACKKAQFFKVGAYDEKIKKWGKEDWLLFFEFYKHGFGCIRSREPEFIHHYHKSLKPDDFVPLF
ncbi:MAG: galactosyltransferase-related protein [Bacteroidia bacterium]